jgi:hypothetical protein
MSSALFIFQDTTDADNFASVIDILRKVIDEIVFFFLVGRRADFSIPYIPMAPFIPKRLSEQFSEMDTSDYNFEDSKRAYSDAARRMQMFLKNAGVFEKITYFVMDDGLIPEQQSPLSHSLFVLDYLFDRNDLFGGSLGEIIKPMDYWNKMQEIINVDDPIKPSEKRRIYVRNIIQSGLKNFTPEKTINLDNLINFVLTPIVFRNIDVFALIRIACTKKHTFGQLDGVCAAFRAQES